VIQYLGRKQRWKEPDQVIRELEVLYARGARSVFFADDNFTVMRRRARELMEKLADWNSCRPAGRMLFSTQASIDLARDPELMKLCAKANMRWVFIGVETPNEESLAETAKRQNLRVDLVEEINKIVRSGIMATCGMIVGFDHDGPDIFERQLEFINRIPVPVITFGLLVAPGATPLHARMAREGRLINHDRLGAGSFLETNIRPLLMSEADLKQGARWLANRIFDPTAYGERVRRFAEECGEADHQGAVISQFDQVLAARLSRLGTAERQLAELMGRLAQTRPELIAQLRYALFFYCQARHLLSYYGVWDPKLAKQELSLAA
jgi:radical SAM superfamily enzyme YgiQ (UPF0313 family)